MTLPPAWAGGGAPVGCPAARLADGGEAGVGRVVVGVELPGENPDAPQVVPGGWPVRRLPAGGRPPWESVRLHAAAAAAFAESSGAEPRNVTDEAAAGGLLRTHASSVAALVRQPLVRLCVVVHVPRLNLHGIGRIGLRRR